MTRWQALFIAAACFGTSRQALAIDPNETDPRPIMTAVEGRDLGDKVAGSFSMVIKDAQGSERTRSGLVKQLRDGGARKNLVMFDGPAEIRNTGVLTYDWDDPSKSDDQWFYLPALARTTRISGAGRSGSFVGSDLSFADLTRWNPNDYDYTMVKPSVQVDGEDCWLVEAVPKTDKERDETGYTKAQLWISKAKLTPLQIAATMRKGGKTKKMKFFDIRQVDGIWTTHKLVVRTEQADALQSMTVMTWSSFAYNRPEVSSAVFTTQGLERGL